jgi:1,4-alpha-glucan branching enzyme
MSMLLFFPVLILARESSLRAEDYSNYLSGEIDEHDQNENKIYTYNELQNLKEAGSPLYIKLMDEGGNKFSRGILFTYNGFKKKSVFIAGTFNNWNQTIMRRNSNDIFFYILPLVELENGEKILSYEYKFMVDGVWTHDPSQKTALDDGLGGFYSVFSVDKEDTDRLITYRIIKEKTASEEKLIEFAVYMPEIRNMSLIGNFNDWNPEHDIMNKGEDGVFRIRRRFRTGDIYYRFVADGKWILDVYNPETVYLKVLGDLVSFIKIK